MPIEWRYPSASRNGILQSELGQPQRPGRNAANLAYGSISVVNGGTTGSIGGSSLTMSYRPPSTGGMASTGGTYSTTGTYRTTSIAMSSSTPVIAMNTVLVGG